MWKIWTSPKNVSSASAVGKRETSESQTLSGARHSKNNCFLCNHHAYKNLSNDNPLIAVSLLSRTFAAVLDSGASLSLIGDEAIELVRLKNIKTSRFWKFIQLAAGLYESHEVVWF